jgi:hypothetical protein
MKKTVFVWHRFVPALFLAGALSGIAVAQKSGSNSTKVKDKEVNVRIIERDGDEVREIERTYRVDGMSDSERDKLVTKLVDSVKTAHKDGRKHHMTIIIEDNTGDRTVTRERVAPGKRRLPGDVYVYSGPLPGFDKDLFNNQNWRYEFRRGTDSLADRLNRFRMQMPKDWDRQLARPFEDWSRNFNAKPSTIRGLDAYPNNPDQNQLNIRFTAPAKGDITILVTNTKGKEVARREIKDFSGEFVGQIDLGKKSQGTYFVTVTQNEDGAVKRIVIDDKN